MKLPEESTYETAPEGTHSATCYQVVDFGSRDFQGDKKFKRKVWIGWELCDELMEDGRPFSVGHEYTLSSYEEAPLRMHLEAWRGAKFADEDFGPKGKFDIQNLLGAACLVSVKHKANGKAKVTAVIAPPKGSDRRITPANPTQYLSLEADEFDENVFNSLPDWIKKVIMESQEFAAVMGAEHAEQQREEVSSADEEEEIPF